MVKSQEAANLINNDIFIKNIASKVPISHPNTLVGGMKWISIPTTRDQYGYGSFGEGTSSKTSINFLAVQQYTKAQSKKIWDVLAADESKYGDSKNSIIFTKEGHLGFPDDARFSNAKNSDAIIFNKLATDNREFGTKYYNADKTLDGFVDIDNFLFRDRTICMFSPNLKWILYFAKNESVIKKKVKGVDSSVPQYYLLYNPIHRKEFKAVYQALLRATKNSGIRANLTDYVQAPGYETTLNKSTYSEIINKYCNAFILPRGKVPGKDILIEHYGDPMCNIIMDSQLHSNMKSLDLGKLSTINFEPDAETHGQLASILRMNITQKSLLQDYYGQPAAQSPQFQQIKSTARNSKAYYICGQDGKSDIKKSFGSFAQNSKTKLLTSDAAGTESFLQDFYNLRKNKDMLKNGQNTNDGSIASQLAKGGCTPVTMDFTFCDISFTTGGDINISAEAGKDAPANVKIENNCGSKTNDKSKGGTGGAMDSLAAAGINGDDSSGKVDQDGNPAPTKTDDDVAKDVQNGGVNYVKDSTVKKTPKYEPDTSQIENNDAKAKAALAAAEKANQKILEDAMAAGDEGDVTDSFFEKYKLYIIAVVVILLLIGAGVLLLF
jgi:hypothetical protein